MGNKIEPFPGNFPGTIKGVLDAFSLLARAEVVVKGQVLWSRPERSVEYRIRDQVVPFQWVVSGFRVDEVLKGEARPETIEVEFLSADFPSSLEDLRAGEYLLLFLARADSRYHFADPTTSKMPVGRIPLPRGGDQRTSEDLLTTALRQSLDDPDAQVAATAAEQLRKAPRR